jgi:hypothetical protein
MDGTAFESKRRASEEQYFAKLAEEQRKKFAERLHEKELKELLQVLPPVRLALTGVVAGCCWRSRVWLLLVLGLSAVTAAPPPPAGLNGRAELS